MVDTDGKSEANFPIRSLSESCFPDIAATVQKLPPAQTPGGNKVFSRSRENRRHRPSPPPLSPPDCHRSSGRSPGCGSTTTVYAYSSPSRSYPSPAVIADYGSMHQQRGIRCGSKGIHQHEGIIQSELTPGIALCHQSGPTIRKSALACNKQHKAFFSSQISN